MELGLGLEREGEGRAQRWRRYRGCETVDHKPRDTGKESKVKWQRSRYRGPVDKR